MADKYKVNTPEEGYTGLIAGVSFVDGEGNTSDEWAVNWFRENGYSITEIEEESTDKTGEVNDGVVEEIEKPSKKPKK